MTDGGALTIDAAGGGADQRIDRTGAIAGISAYGIWGLFPLVFHQLSDVLPVEVLIHRVVWSFVLVVGWLTLRGDNVWRSVVRTSGTERRRLAASASLITINWLTYVWAVSNEHVIEAALGYYINPLITVALGVVILRERLRRMQRIALGFAAAAVAVLAVAYGQVPWIALTLAFTFAGYGALKRSVTVGAVTSMAVETALLAPMATVGLIVLQLRGDAALGHGPVGRDLLLLSLGVLTPVPLALFAASARRLPLTMLGMLQYLTPTLQLLCGVVVLGEDLPAERLLGFVLVWVALAALALDLFRFTRRPRHAVV